MGQLRGAWERWAAFSRAPSCPPQLAESSRANLGTGSRPSPATLLGRIHLPGPRRLTRDPKMMRRIAPHATGGTSGSALRRSGPGGWSGGRRKRRWGAGRRRPARGAAGVNNRRFGMATEAGLRKLPPGGARTGAAAGLVPGTSRQKVGREAGRWPWGCRQRCSAGPALSAMFGGCEFQAPATSGLPTPVPWC